MVVRRNEGLVGLMLLYIIWKAGTDKAASISSYICILGMWESADFFYCPWTKQKQADGSTQTFGTRGETLGEEEYENSWNLYLIRPSNPRICHKNENACLANYKVLSFLQAKVQVSTIYFELRWYCQSITQRIDEDWKRKNKLSFLRTQTSS